LKQELEQVRRRGYAIDDQEEEIGVRCIGAAVVSSGQQPLAAISITGTIDQINADTLDSFVAKVKGAAASIADELAPHPVAATAAAAVNSALQ
jgi:DNA-binding IclR family transcriptional regulator